MTDIEAIIAEATAANATTSATPEAGEGNTAETLNPEQPTEPEGPEGDQGEGDKASQGEEFSKKARNAISYRDKKIGKLQAKIEQLQSERESLRSTTQNPAASAAGEAPKETDYETYGDYLRAVARWEAKRELSEVQQRDREERIKSTDDELAASEREREALRAEAIDESAVNASKVFPDFAEVIEKNATLRMPDGRSAIPLSPALKSALLESDNGAFALYSILKDGALEDANSLSPAKAAMLVARHEDKAVAASRPKTVSSAPDPLPAAKGRGSSSKPLAEKSVEEVMQWMKSS